MKTILKAIAFYALMLTGALAANQPGAVVSPVPVANVASITAGHWGPSAVTLKTCGYYACGDGGENTYTYSATPCTVDGGSCIRDVDGNYYTAPVTGNARQYGVTSGSTYDWVTNHTSTTDITPVLQAMATALQAQGLNSIDLAGTSVYMKTNYAIADNFNVTCDAVIGPADNNSWYNDVPGAIYKAHGVDITRDGRSTSIHDCFILADNLVTANIPNTTAKTRAALDAQINGGDTALKCDAQGCNDYNLFIVGFDTGYDLGDGATGRLTNSYIDADVCYWPHQAGGGMQWYDNECFTYLTKNSPSKKLRYDIASISAGAGGVCHLTVTPQAGDPAVLADLAYAKYIYTNALADGPSACEGRHTVTNVDTGAGTFDLVGTVVAGPQPYCNWAAGVKIIYCSDETNIANGESITARAADGIPNPTKVLIQWRLPPQAQGYITDTGGAANTYVANAVLAQQPCTLSDPLNVAFTAAHTNTAASTLNITLQPTTDGGGNPTGCTGGTTGAIAIVHPDGTALIANDIITGTHILVRYSATYSKWVLIRAKVYLDTATTAAHAANIQTQFVGSVCGGAGPSCGAGPEADIVLAARVDAGASPGGVAAGGSTFATCFLVGGPINKDLPNTDRVAGFQAVNPLCFDHSYGYHIWNSNETGILNLANDSAGFDDDPDTVILLVDGHTNNVHIHGRKAGKGGRSIIVNVVVPDDPDRGVVTWTGAAVASTTGFFPVTDVEQGCFSMINGVTNTSGYNTISNFANCARYDVSMKNVTNVYEGAAARAATDTTGSILAGGQSYLLAGVGLQTNTTTNLLETTGGGHNKTLTLSANTTYTNNDCGAHIYGDATAQRTATLPASPPVGCSFAFEPVLFDVIINGNGLNMRFPGFGQHDLTNLRYPYTQKLGFLTIAWNGTRWDLSDHSTAGYEAFNSLDDQTLVHGQVYFDYDSGNTRFRLCQKNGPGGLLLQGAQMHAVPSLCLFYGAAGTTSSALNYFYAFDQGDVAISNAADNGLGSHLVRLTTASLSFNTGDQVGVDCHSINGTIEALGWNTATVIDSTHLDLIGVGFVNAFTTSASAGCRVWGLISATTGHTTFNGVEVETGSQSNTLVGMSYVEAAHAVTDSATKRYVASWFNRKLKTCKNVFTADRTTTSATYVELNSEIECNFVTWGIDDLGWQASGMMNNTTNADGGEVSACFDTATTPAETEETGVLNAIGAQIIVPFSVRGSKTGLTENKHYVTLCGHVSGGGTLKVNGVTPVSSLGIAVPQ